MPKAIRQENLYGAEDWSVIYTSFKNAEFRSYDFDTLRQSMVDYMQVNYAEEFNDYTQNSEFIALLDLVAYVGQNLAFRMDLNARENILDTAEKRESVLRIARMLSYKPKRVRPAQGFLKVVSVVTTDQILDSTGVNLANRVIQWGSDPSELEYERFVKIVNAALNKNNQFGTPTKRSTNSSTGSLFEIYSFDNISQNADLLTHYSVPAEIDGLNLNFDILPVDINAQGYITQQEPDFNSAFTMMYRNDGKGVGSTKTGFFFFTKQGNLVDDVQQVYSPIANLSLDISASSNISEEDFYVQTIDDAGGVLKTWKRVSNLDFSNIVLNDFSGSDKDLYEVIYSDADITSIKFGDGTFTNIPTGKIRIWYRSAENDYVRVKAREISNVTFDISYYDDNNLRQTLTLILELQDNMVTGLPAETVDEIKRNAPEAFYSKNRMVTGDDYNGFLPTLNNDVMIMKAENRTFSGHSRYVDLSDPTGKSRPLIEFADDGYLYKDESIKNSYVADDASRRTVDLLDEYIEKQLADVGLLNFYFSKLNLENAPGTTYIDTVTLGKTIYYTTLVAPIGTAPITEFTVSSVNTNNAYDNFDVRGGLVQIGNELFKYSSIVGNTFKGVRRAYEGTVAASHAPGTQVFRHVDYCWQVAYNDLTSSNGYIAEFADATIPQKVGYTTGGQLRSLRPGSMLKFKSANGTTTWVSVSDIKGDGLGIEDIDGLFTGKLINGNGVIEISKSITTNDRLVEILPPFVRVFDDNTRSAIIEKLVANESFAIKFNNTIPSWTLITSSTNKTAAYNRANDSTAWIININREANGWTISTRQLDYVFGSEELIRFYNINFSPTFNPNFKSVSNDYISLISIDSGGKLTTLQKYRISGYYVYDDGYTDNSKIKVTPLDLDNDFLPDDPEHFSKIVGANRIALINYDEEEFSYNIPAPLTTTEPIIKVTNGKLALAFKWEHNVNIDQTLNPSLTNIIDSYVLTKTYNDDFTVWKRKNDPTLEIPLPPTSEELRDSFTSLLSYKMMTDEVIFHPVKFKPLFGKLASPEYQAQFKVVKHPKSKLTDSEVKSKVVAAIDTFFAPGNFGFGEIFYFTELAAYIHTALSTDLNSVVVVPLSAEGRFGTLFQIQPDRNEVVTSVAGVNDIIVINEITDTNIRISR